MEVLKTLNTDCVIDKVSGISKKTGKAFTGYRVAFPSLNVKPIFLPYGDKAVDRLSVILDILGDPPSSK